MPVVKGNISIRAVEGEVDDPFVSLIGIDMIWDTGAHMTTITEELLPANFIEYLKDEKHTPYRAKGGLYVQMDAVLRLTNAPINISCNVLITPKRNIPNGYSGILLGQRQVIDAMVLRNIPRRILNATGEDVGKEFWGDIIIEKYVNMDDELTTF
jgi:hypothetical protein